MNKSESIGKLAGALALAQAEMPDVKKNAQNPFLKNKYADLGAVIETSRPVLAKHGLSISQFPTSEADKIGVTSILMHTSGEYIEDTIYISTSDSKGLSVAQTAGVVISYLRRYSWASILGMYADEDTDGSTPKQAKVEIQPSKSMTYEDAIEFQTAKKTPFKTLTKEQLQEVADKSQNEKQREAARIVIAHMEKEGK